MTFLLRHGSGIVCTPMSNEIADRLELDFMVQVNTDNHGTAFTVTVDAIGAERASRRETVLEQSTLLPHQTPVPKICGVPATCSRYALGRGVFWNAMGIPRRPSTWCGWPVAVRLR
ncbi:3,4-dihydroxy-2-butanone-4-phosphate synthase [Rhodococcus opacus]|nr:3,4-dihydroxy-2-butanone-4-phosphate synthase [Rhodococcus opacus]